MARKSGDITPTSAKLRHEGASATEVADVASASRRRGGGMSLLVHLLLPSALGGRWFPLDAAAPATLAAGRAMPLYPLPALYLPGSTCMVAAPAALPTPPAAPAAAAAPTAGWLHFYF